MNECREERRWCYLHPREMVVGVCALCLKERLLAVASNQETKTSYTYTPKRVLHKIFVLTNLLKNSDIKHHRSEVYDDHHSSSPTPEDSFISIKFEENGVASWDKGKLSKISHNQCEMPNSDKNKNKIKIKSVIEHSKPRGSLRWRRPIGQLFHLIKWKRPSKEGKVCHLGTKLQKEKVKYGWIRTLTKRKARE